MKGIEMTHANVYTHQPGNLSKRAVLDIGLKCTHSCNFCYYSFLDKTDSQFSGMRKTPFRKLEDLYSIIDGFTDFESFDITGGEPTLHPNIVEIIKYATEKNKKTRIITLGQFMFHEGKLFKKDGKYLLDRLLDAGVTNFLFSVHGHTEDLFNKITKESLNAQMKAWDYLANINFEFTTNTTVVNDNYQHLPDIARLVSKSNSYMHNFIFMNAYFEWNVEGRVFGKQAKFSEAKKYMDEAIDILESNGIAVNIRYMPMCVANQKNLVGVVGVRYDPYEWMNAETHLENYDVNRSKTPIQIQKGFPEPAYYPFKFEKEFKIENTTVFAGRGGSGGKVFTEKCKSCHNILNCDGVDPKYIKQYGDSEITPIDIPANTYPPLVNTRAEYLPAFSVKNHQFAKMKEYNKKYFKNMGQKL